MTTDNPPGPAYEIRELWAWTTVTPTDGEGIVQVFDGGVLVPAIGTNAERTASLRSLVRAYAATVGQPVRLRHFVPADDDREIAIAPPQLS